MARYNDKKARVEVKEGPGIIQSPLPKRCEHLWVILQTRAYRTVKPVADKDGEIQDVHDTVRHTFGSGMILQIKRPCAAIVFTDTAIR